MQNSREIDFGELMEAKKNEPGPMIRFDPLDLKLGGLHRRLIVLGGYSGSYKTTFVLNIAYNNAVELGYNVAFLSLEMDPSELWLKFLLRHAQHQKFSKQNIEVTIKDNNWSSLSVDQRDFLRWSVATDLNESDYYGTIFIFTQEDLLKYKATGLFDAATKQLDALGVVNGIDLLIVDYLQLLANFTRPAGVDRYQYSGDVIRYLKNLTQVYKNVGRDGITVIALSQINREGFRYAREHNGKYDLTCLAESSELANAADVVLTLYADAEDKKNKKCRVQLLKNRFGETIEDPIEMLALPGNAYIGGYRQNTVEEMNEIVRVLLGNDF